MELFYSLPVRATPETDEYLDIVRRITGKAISTNTILLFTNFTTTQNNQFDTYLRREIVTARGRNDSGKSLGALITAVHNKELHEECGQFDRCCVLENNRNSEEQRRALIAQVKQFESKVIATGGEKKLSFKDFLLVILVILIGALVAHAVYKSSKCK